MNLFEWKQQNIADEKQRIKDAINEDIDYGVSFLSEEELNIALLENEIEQFSEYVDFTGELDIESDLLEDCIDIQEEYQFEPNEFGDRMDLEVEFDLNIYELNMMTLGKVRDTLFAEDYEVTIDEAGNKAKVVFNRAGGQISKKKKCGPGMKLKGNRCVPQTGTQKNKERVKGIKLKRAKKAIGAGQKKKAALKTKITKKRVKSRNRSFSNTTN